MAHSHIILDVSGRKFRTSKSVLSVSPYFDSLLTRWEDCKDLQDDGSYYIDADADTFEHLLNFMRRPSRFPLYWTKKAGFDYPLYCRLEAEADYFMLEGLRNWIKEKRYLKAILIIQRTGDPTEDNRRNPYSSRGADITFENFVLRQGGGRPLCPSGRHNIGGESCIWDSRCKESMAGNGVQFSSPVDTILSISTETIFVNSALINEAM